MNILAAFAKIVAFPGRFVTARFPDLDAEHSRLVNHMVNYVFWLTPTVGVIIWLVIRYSIANARI